MNKPTSTSELRSSAMRRRGGPSTSTDSTEPMPGALEGLAQLLADALARRWTEELQAERGHEATQRHAAEGDSAKNSPDCSCDRT